MAKKKKEIKEEKVFVPSKYQEDIFKFIIEGQGNVVISACAGSGKSTTLVQAIKLIPTDKKILFCAFNKDIVTDLNRKIGKVDNVELKTIHSLGYSILQKNIGGYVPINENKYRQELYSNIKNYTLITKYLSKHLYLQYVETVLKLVDLLRVNLCTSSKEAEPIVTKYDLEIIDDEVNVALELIEWGKENTKEIDYTDMLWLPLTLRMPPKGSQYDFIFIDECQDLSCAQRELILKCHKINTRIIAVGDPNQAIYGFNGADYESFEALRKLPNTISLPLSISYRCANKIVDFAQIIVPTIERNNDGREGEIIYDCHLSDINDGDMILCRNNAPLAKAYADIISMGKKCFIRGKDIGTNLKGILKKCDYEYLHLDLKEKGVFSHLYKKLFEDRDKLIEQTKLKPYEVMNMSIMSSKYDALKSLEILAEGCKTKEELLKKIDEIFSDKSKEGIALSTIHKAKGLEANNTFIVMPSLMPSKSATQPWQLLQEQNLKYVAYTRAKDKLGFVSEAEFSDLSIGINETLEHIEKRIYDLYSLKPSDKVTKENYKEVLRNIKPTTAQVIPTKKNNITLSGTKPSTGLGGALTMSGLIKPKIIKKK